MNNTILSKLTDVKLEASFNIPKQKYFIELQNQKIPCYFDSALVVGSGAAGFRAAVELQRRDISTSIITSILYGGTSACSGSDKQTIFSCSTYHHGDDVIEVAKAISAGGCMDADLAYVEAVNSYISLDGLRTFGLDLPCDKYGTILRYQTDHDEKGRATSCGPRTSRLMVKVLSQEASRLGVKLLDKSSAVSIIVSKNNIAIGIVGCSCNLVSEKNPNGLFVFKAKNIVLAGGGAGELYRDSVYPYKCIGTVGIALEAGLEVSNIQEHQFGIGTPRGKFPWNLSGTYMQVIPDIYSLDKEGKKYHFLDNYYLSTKDICSNIFRKGYQWPVHALRTLNYGSSLFDLAVYIELRKERKVFLDFRQNYKSEIFKEFQFDDLDDDVKKYLYSSKSTQNSPIERLKNMNQLAIELYKLHGFDLEKEPLEFSINHQHFNGGIKVNTYAQSSINNIYVIGESAGTHGVTRPGGAALNSGQVFALRAAIHICNKKEEIINSEDNILYSLSDILAFLHKCKESKGIDFNILKSTIQNIMSDKCSFVCSEEKVLEAKNKLEGLLEDVLKYGISNSQDAENSLLLKSLLFEGVAIANALYFYIKKGGGSRGARIICSNDSKLIPLARNVNLSEFALIPERELDKKEIIDVKFDCNFIVKITTRAIVKDMKLPSALFESQWKDFLEKKIY